MRFAGKPGRAGVPVRINDPQCVNKTFPTYFDVFATLGQQLMVGRWLLIGMWAWWRFRCRWSPAARFTSCG